MQYYIKVEPGVSINVTDVNPESKKVILFIHGWPLNSRMFEYQLNKIPQQGYRCIAIDIRGFGRSDKPISGYSYDRISDDIRIIIEWLGLQDITLVGHSVGGAIATRYMARHNNYGVSKLVLIGAAAPSFVKTPSSPYGNTKEDVNKIIEDVYSNHPKALQAFTDIFFFQYITEQFSNWILNMGLEAEGYSMAGLMSSIGSESLFNDLSKINVPTLIAHGIHDKICPFKFTESLKKGIKNSTLIPFEYSGHALFWEERDKFNDELIKFIK